MKQHHQRPLAVGDFCTIKSKYPENGGLRVRLIAGVLLATIWWELLGVAPEESRQASLDLLKASISAADQHAADSCCVPDGLHR